MRTLAALVVLVAACSSDSGEPPTISALTYTPMTMTLGQPTTVSGSIEFVDEDGDLDKLRAEVVMPDGTLQAMQPADIRGVGDTTTGTLAFALSFVPPQTGTYRFTLWLTDEGDNESNKLEGTLTAN